MSFVGALYYIIHKQTECENFMFEEPIIMSHNEENHKNDRICKHNCHHENGNDDNNNSDNNKILDVSYHNKYAEEVGWLSVKWLSNTEIIFYAGEKNMTYTNTFLGESYLDIIFEIDNKEYITYLDTFLDKKEKLKVSSIHILIINHKSRHQAIFFDVLVDNEVYTGKIEDCDYQYISDMKKFIDEIKNKYKQSRYDMTSSKFGHFHPLPRTCKEEITILLIYGFVHLCVSIIALIKLSKN